MAKILVLLAAALLVTGFAAAPATASSIGPFGFDVGSGSTRTCIDVFLRGHADEFSLKGRTAYVDGVLAEQVVIGRLAIIGGDAVWGLEIFPTALSPVAVKMGGRFALATLLGNTSLYLLKPQGIFQGILPFRIIERCLPGPADGHAE
jgi:hypothetical protein